MQEACFDTAGALADAYKLGKLESESAHNLLKNVPEEIVAELTSMVRRPERAAFESMCF